MDVRTRLGNLIKQSGKHIMVTSRIQSNLETHGYDFAVQCEANRMIRKGYSKRTAIAYATALVAQVQALETR
jgi:hypothetical protein